MNRPWEVVLVVVILAIELQIFLIYNRFKNPKQLPQQMVEWNVSKEGIPFLSIRLDPFLKTHLYANDAMAEAIKLAEKIAPGEGVRLLIPNGIWDMGEGLVYTNRNKLIIEGVR